MDSILEAIGGFILRGIGYFLIEIVFEVIFYLTGYLALKGITLGRYPQNILEFHNRERQDVYCMCVGAIFWLSLFAFILYEFSK